jgi:hypothetical protein
MESGVDPQDMHFIAMLYEKKRFSYDKSDRISLRVIWSAPIGVRAYDYSYSKDIQRYRTTKRTDDQFWNKS